MTNRVQVQRLPVTNTIPAPGSRDPGELWLNLADFQLGFIDALKVAQKLIAVRFFEATASYFVNEFVTHNGSIWVANGTISPGAFSASQWTEIGVGGGGGGTPGGGPYLPLAGGLMTGSLYLAFNPVSANEAATKSYVDSAVSGGGSGGPFLPLAGGTMLGDVTLFRDPTTAFMAATKGYVDAHSGGGSGAYLPLAGGTMTGPIVLAADPTTASQAANKHYVDTALAGGGGVAGNCPTGAILDFASATAPTGWVKCDGSAYLSTDPLYSALYAVIGLAFGSAPGGYFKVPDLRNRVTVGDGSTYTLGNIGGAATVTLSVAQLATHKHADTTGHVHDVYQDPHHHAITGTPSAAGVVTRVPPIPSFQLIDDAGPTAGPLDFSGLTTDTLTPTVHCGIGYSAIDNAGSSQPHENMPPYMALTKIIKL